MRMMLKVSMPTEASNAAVKDGSLGPTLMGAIERLKPEPAYFFPEDGKRTALYFFDLENEAQIPVVAEPFFRAVNADITLIPVMNADDVAKGIEAAAKFL